METTPQHALCSLPRGKFRGYSTPAFLPWTTAVSQHYRLLTVSLTVSVPTYHSVIWESAREIVSSESPQSSLVSVVKCASRLFCHLKLVLFFCVYIGVKATKSHNNCKALHSNIFLLMSDYWEKSHCHNPRLRGRSVKIRVKVTQGCDSKRLLSSFIFYVLLVLLNPS